MIAPPLILGIGAAHPDRRGLVIAAPVMGASNPGRMVEDIGGGAFNAVRAAGMRGLSMALISARGGDMAGSAVEAALEQAGVEDLSGVHLDRATPGYTAILGPEGDVVIALADMQLYETGLSRHLRRSPLQHAIRTASAVLVDANLAVSALENVAKARGGAPLFAVAISPAKAVRLAVIARHMTVLFCNRREASALTGLHPGADAGDLASALRARGFGSAVVTDGASPVLAYRNDASWTILPPSAVDVVDVTGAGDALAGAAAAALTQGRAFMDAVREGIAAAALTVQSPRSTAASLDGAPFEAMLAHVGPALPLADLPEIPT